MQVTNVENESKSFNPKPKKRKFAKELSTDKSVARARKSNALDDIDPKEDNAIDRPRKKNARKKLRHKQKKLQQKSDGFFCGAPSKRTKRLV